MSDKKNIDRLFQEKFKDFEVEPNEQIWINIDAALREKKKRRILPFWLRSTGIAAGLVLGFFVWNFLFTDTTPVENNPVVLEKRKPVNNDLSIDPKDNESVANTEKTIQENNTNRTINSSSIHQKTNSTTTSATVDKNAVVHQTQPSRTKRRGINSEISSQENNTVATTSRQVEKISTKKKTVKNSILPRNQDNAVVNNDSKSRKDNETSTAAKANNINSISTSKENNAVVLEDKDNSGNKDFLKKNSSTEKKPNTSIAENKKSANEQNRIKKDSTALAVAEPNALEELLNKNEEEKNTIAEAKMNRWQITSNVAPIYFSSTSNGSPIDAQFADNSKSYENNLSFGVGLNYAVNKKISVRTGINKFTLGYNTNDVVFFAAMDPLSLGSVASSSAGSTIQVISQNNTEALRPFDNGIQNTNEGIMSQKMGYFEVPLEMSYKIIDKKFGINLIGGVSTLFLNENEVSVSSSTMSASLGRAKNLNDVHFSTNVGLGFRYRFLKSFEANFEPMFKYQINTFNKDAGNFKPYFIGLYSGVSFNF